MSEADPVRTLASWSPVKEAVVTQLQNSQAALLDLPEKAYLYLKFSSFKTLTFYSKILK